ncbi:hypothetical protein NXY11_06800 [Parabacteroides faecis]|uniref:lipopolysaccharide biosynthesis protein n=1 Tax=Parabacteroides faecis TaxID=1217282 RepID=UPI0021647DE8|nr:hypothetical protein [Parabacteroides faecis]MCS2893470.1 hypothetical protein [Parabacteroides faecis]UVQ47931.1 hypothetical protein NXY11_06800 [Parabacteroides faecis]
MNQIKIGAAIGYLSVALNFILGLVYTPWMVHQIGVSDYGLYSLAGAFMSYFLLDFGLAQTMGRFLSLAVAKGDKERVCALMSTAFRIYLIIDSIIFLALLICYIFISDIFIKLTPEELEKFKVVFCFSAGCSLLSFPLMPVSGVMISHQKFIPLKLCDFMHKLLVVVITIILLLLDGGLYGLVITNGLVGVGIAYYKLFYVRNRLNVNFSIKKYDSSIAKSLFSFSVWVFIVVIAQRFVVNICPTILGMKASTTQISVFAIATTLEANIWMFSQTLNGLFMPKVADLSLKDTAIKDISNLMIRVGRLQLQLAGLVITGFIAFGSAFIKLWMGDSFADSYWITAMMISTGLITYTESVAESLLYVKNEVKYRAAIFISCAVLSCIASFLLSPKYGALGCGYSILFTNAFCHVIAMNCVYKFKLKLEVSRFFHECHVAIIVPILILMTGAILLQRVVVLHTWLSLCLAISAYVILYVLSAWCITMNNSEKDLFLNLLKKLRLIN